MLRVRRGDGRPGESALKITVESHFSWIVISMSVLLLVAVALLVIFMVGHRRHRKELRMHFELAELSRCGGQRVNTEWNNPSALLNIRKSDFLSYLTRPFSVPNHSQPSVSSNTNVIIELDTSLLNGMGSNSLSLSMMTTTCGSGHRAGFFASETDRRQPATTRLTHSCRQAMSPYPQIQM